MPLRDSALLLLGHGSTLNADSSAPTYQHAEEIRLREIFAEVHVGFWKEEPNFRQSLRQTNCARVYVAPNFISSGYFTEQVIPRELGLTGELSRLGNQEVIYCEPVGLHPAMREALLKRASEVVSTSNEKIFLPERTACLFICGHGTSLNDNSTKIIHEQANAIRALGLYADCQAVLMEQTPFVKDWRTLTSCPDAIVVPFFISDGLHSFEDIPVLLGLTDNVREKAFQNPHREGNRRLWYSSAIGTEDFLADVIVSQVEVAERKYSQSSTPSQPSYIGEALAQFGQHTPLPWTIGQVLIGAHFELRHVEDAAKDTSSLHPVGSIADLRELIRLDEQEAFRPLRAAPNLRSGWIYRASNFGGLRLALDYLYPAELANWVLNDIGGLPVTPWQETAERQTGRFRVVRKIDMTTLADLVAENCERRCLKRRLWSPKPESPAVAANEMPLLCPEACNFLVGKAREKWESGGKE